GDKHHYARYEAAKDTGPQGRRMRITAGGGGAFLSTTQKLADPLHVPRPSGDNNPATDDTEPFELACRYPNLSQSRRLNGRIFLLGLRNPSFTVIPAILYILLFFATVSRLASQDNDGEIRVDPAPWRF